MLRFNYLLHVLILLRRGVSNFSLSSLKQRETEIGFVFFCVLTIMKVTYAFSIDHNDDCLVVFVDEAERERESRKCVFGAVGAGGGRLGPGVCGQKGDERG